VCCTVGEFEQKTGQATLPGVNPSRGAMIVGLTLLTDIVFCYLSVAISRRNIVVFAVQDRGGGMQMVLRSKAECTTVIDKGTGAFGQLDWAGEGKYRTKQQ
jgi:hypothetical protein